MFFFGKPKISLKELSSGVVTNCLMVRMKEDVDKLARESREDRLQLLREYIGFRSFALYHGSLCAFHPDQKAWERYIGAIGEQFSTLLVKAKTFSDADAFQRFVDERGAEYHSLWKASPTYTGEMKGNPVFKLSLGFGNHVAIADLAVLTYWGGIWVNWVTLDKQLVEKVLREARIV